MRSDDKKYQDDPRQYFSLCWQVELCSRLKTLSEVMDEGHFYNELESIKRYPTEFNYMEILKWIQDKTDKNGWVLKCISAATSKMNRNDWYATSMTINVAENAHALSQKDDKHLSLVGAI